MAATLKVLFIATAHTALGDTGDATGLWFEELATPYYVFTDSGAQVSIATLPGGVVPLDPRSADPNEKKPASVERFVRDEAAMAQMQSAEKLSALSFEDYDVVFIPGGHGAMWDLGSSVELGEFLTKAWAGGKIVASVCHGPAGLVNAKEIDGKPLVAGKKVSAFSDSEETAMKLTQVVPFMLESKLWELGADYRSGPDFQAYAVRDGRLVTGQNPASSEKVAKLALEAAGEHIR